MLHALRGRVGNTHTQRATRTLGRAEALQRLLGSEDILATLGHQRQTGVDVVPPRLDL